MPNRSALCLLRWSRAVAAVSRVAITRWIFGTFRAGELQIALYATSGVAVNW